MNEFLAHYAELVRDPAHAAVEVTTQVVIDGLFLGLLWPLLKRAMRREHQAIDAEHGVDHYGHTSRRSTTMTTTAYVFTPVDPSWVGAVWGKRAKPYDPALDPEPLLLEEVERIEAQRVTVVGDDLTVTTINGVDVDLRGDAQHDTTCADCSTALKVDIVPEGLTPATVAGVSRTVCCTPCGNKRIEAAQVVEVLNPIEEDLPVFDLTQYSPGQLAAIIVVAQERMVAKEAEGLPARREKALLERAQALLDEAALKAADTQARRGLVLPAFTVAGKDVPALDLSDVGNLGETVSAKQRSPYNKALAALSRPILNKETTTYADLQRVHLDLSGQPQVQVTVATGPILAQVEPDAPAVQRDPKAEALATVQGVTYEEAHAHLVSVGVL